MYPILPLAIKKNNKHAEIIHRKKTIQIPLTIILAKLLVFIGYHIKIKVQKYEFILNVAIERFHNIAAFLFAC